eukprot:8224489-Alexandrium_andersonii.AAC.1
MCDHADVAEYAAVAENLRTLSPKKRRRRKIPTCAFPRTSSLPAQWARRRFSRIPRPRRLWRWRGAGCAAS